MVKSLGTSFNSIDLSSNTKRGLKDSHFIEMTLVQENSIPSLINGHDLLIISPTGTGKTLSYIVPLLEILYNGKWNRNDGLGALIIVPTRELAIQIFDVLKKIGKYHSFSAGLIIGGKSYSLESRSIGKMNIIISTPGRLLQHLDQSHSFSTYNLKLLVVDEADKLLDLGFERSMKIIFRALPLERQTVMLSATCGDSLSLFTKSCIDFNHGLYLKFDALDSCSSGSLSQFKFSKTPILVPCNLSHYVHICQLNEKIDFIFNFLRLNSKCKIIVFVSSCKQVRYFHEVFRRLQLPTSILSLHGRQKQLARTQTFYSFCKKQSCILFSTDISSRGLDFPSVDWVVHFDCPENKEAYVHRSGRTARLQSKGSSLIILIPEETQFLKNLSSECYSLSTYSSPQKLTSIVPKIQQLCSQHHDIKYLGQRAFITYLKSFYIQNHEIKIHSEILEKFANSLGLMSLPRLRFLS